MSDFASLGLSQALVSAVEKMGFETPTPIQAQAIPKLLEDNTDLVGLAQTGTGKTAAFGLPLIDLVDIAERNTQALVLAPTRELCLQISKELQRFAKNHKGLKIQEVYGGTDIGRQIRELRKGAHIIAATPGRLRDLINRKAVNIENIEYVVLDEADEMLNMGFKEEIDDILSHTPDDKLTWLFSATMPREVRRIAKNYMTDPLEISAGERNVSNTDIDHKYVLIRPSDRYEALRRYLDFDPSIFGLVFTRTRRDAKELSDRLTHEGYSADALHGDLNQTQRDRVMERFRRKSIRMLIATDVAARGIDVADISHVFHFNIPDDQSFYTHRSGRTGRAGNKGISLVLAHPNDIYILRRMEKVLKVEFSQDHIPTGMEICEKRLMSQILRLKNADVSEHAEPFLPAIKEELEELTKEELIERLTTVSFSGLLNNYRNTRDLNPRNRGERRDGGGRRNGGGGANGMRRLFINVGSMDVDGKSGFLSLLCNNSGVEGSAVGQIDLRPKHTFFDIESTAADKLLTAFSGAMLEGREIRVNDGDSKSGGGGGGGGRRRHGGGGGRGRGGDRRHGGGGRGRHGGGGGRGRRDDRRRRD